ncbi:MULTISPECIES: MAPEG family protein [Pacificimonas]|nr:MULTISPECIES: MAPEG family protein [Pacificimonas]MBZ6379936.1 MAPEG family protein [Pacificimonas aurantium]
MNELFYPLTSLGVLAVVIAYAYAMIMVGRARGKYEVKVPATTGPDGFVRAFRAHQNSLEQIVVFLPLVAILSALYGDLAGGIYAFIFALGRFLFVRGYNIAAEKRVPGFMIGLVANLLALIACLVGIVVQLVA